MEFIDLKTQYDYLKDEINQNISTVLSNAKFIGGSEVEELEEKLEAYTGRKHCITCGNGTDALQLAYMALGVKEGDAVFCPDMTFIASVEPVCLLGGTPIFVDVDINTYNIDPVCLEKRIEEIKKEGKLNLKAVTAVDFLGNPAQYDKIKEICNKYDLYLIEDAAQSMGAHFQNKKCCSFGDIACTSFFPSKPLGCYGDGGAVFTDNDEWAELIRSLKVHGKGKSKYDNVRIGINSRLDTIQAAVLLSKLSILDEEIGKRQMIAEEYRKHLTDLVKVPYIASDMVSSYAQYCVLLNSSEEREYVIDKMKQEGIPTLIYYPNALHSLEAFKDEQHFNKENFRHTVRYSKCNLGLPFSPYLKEEDQTKVIRVLSKSVEDYRKEYSI